VAAWPGIALGAVIGLGFGEHCLVDRLPDGGTMGDGAVSEGGAVGFFQDDGRGGLDDFDHGLLQEGFGATRHCLTSTF
jgi:hypothetical protein